MSVTLYAFESNGDNNLEMNCFDSDHAQIMISEIRKNKGYATNDREGRLVFVPWHMIEFFRIEEAEESNG